MNADVDADAKVCTPNSATETKEIELLEMNTTEEVNVGKDEDAVTVDPSDTPMGYDISSCGDPFMTHLSPMFKLGSTRPLEMGDLGITQEYDSVVNCQKELQEMWDEECKKPAGTRKLRRVFLGFIGRWKFFFCFWCFSLYALNMFAAPIIMKTLLMHFAGVDVLPQWKLYCVAAYSLIAPPLCLMSREYAVTTLNKAGMRLRNGLMPMIFDRALNLSPAARTSNAGSINNLFASDTNMLAEIWPQFLFVTFSPFQIAVVVYMLYDELGKSIFMSFAVVGGAFPFLLLAAMGFGKYIRQKMVFTDARIKLTKEVCRFIVD